MSDPMKDAWNDVADGFTKLGDAMRDRYRSETAGGDDAADSAAGASDASAGEARLREAFERLVEAGRDVGQRSVDVLRDADVNAQAKDAARSLNEALSATVDMIGNEVSRWFGRRETTPADDGADEAVDAHSRDADPAAAAAMVDQQLQDAEGGIEASAAGEPGRPADPQP